MSPRTGTCKSCHGPTTGPGIWYCDPCRRVPFNQDPDSAHTFTDLDAATEFAARIGVTFYRTPLGGTPTQVA